MNLKAYSLLDTKAGIFHAPFFVAHHAMAVRACADLAGDLSTTVGRHPADFALIEIGDFDDQTGQLTPCAPVQHGTCSSFIKPRPGTPLFADLTIPPKPANGSAEEHV